MEKATLKTEGQKITEENTPQFTFFSKIKRFKKELFDHFVCYKSEYQDLILSSILVKNSRVFITGNPESGKTTLIRLIAQGLSKETKSQSNPSTTYAKATGAPEQTMQKVISTTNISKLVSEGKDDLISEIDKEILQNDLVQIHSGRSQIFSLNEIKEIFQKLEPSR